MWINNFIVDYILSKIIIIDNFFGCLRKVEDMYMEEECIFFNFWMFYNYICGELMIFSSVDLY